LTASLLKARDHGRALAGVSPPRLHLGREASADEEGNKSFRGDLSDLFSQHADNTFLVKVSYWFAR
jgi:hypothetical protein